MESHLEKIKNRVNINLHKAWHSSLHRALLLPSHDFRLPTLTLSSKISENSTDGESSRENKQL